MEDICSICLISPIPDLDLCITNCGHTYCKECLDEWMNRLEKKCPICRQDIIYYMYNNNQIRPVLSIINNNYQNLVRTNQNFAKGLKILTLLTIAGISTLFCLFIVKAKQYDDLEKVYKINCH